MNAIVSLVHFCEVDGPSVIFCTQAFHKKVVEDYADGLSVSSGEIFPDRPLNESPRENGIQANRKEPSNIGRPAPASCASCAFVLPPMNTSGDAKVPSAYEIKGFRTDDDENPMVTYIGSRYPQHSQLYAAVRQACVRSLSCEFCCQGREGPVLFGDDKDGYVLSYMFKIKDNNARGFQRWYSFIFLMTDRVYLVASWPFLVSKFRTLATSLQSRANQVFEKENAARESRQDDSFLSRSGPISPTSPDLFLRRRSKQPLRSLVDLLKTKDFYVLLHANFSWILKACGRRLQERHLNDQKLVIVGNIDSCAFSQKTKLLLDPIYCYDAKGTNSNSSSCSTDEFDTRIDHIKDLYDLLGVQTFRKLVLNFARGNQMIIRSSEPTFVKSVVTILKDLMPSEYCEVLEDANEYQPLTECNILGLDETIKIPDEIDKSTICLATKFDLKFGVEESDVGINDMDNLYINQLSGILKLNLQIEFISIRLLIFREQWSSKAKQYRRFIMGGNENCNLDKEREIAKALDINEIDLPIIRFLSGYSKI
ncbi:11455_t:CDS:2, partial [Acaulospora morrowiae]